MNITIKNLIRYHAMEDEENEICGIVYRAKDKLFIHKCQNIAIDKTEEFEIDSEEFISCYNKGEIVYIYHSQHSNAFSEEDIIRANELIIPLILFNPKTDYFSVYYPPDYKPDYIGREFIWGFNDCYTLIREYYRREYLIPLSDYDADEGYELTGQDKIVNNFEKEGFSKIDIKNIEKGDLIAFKIHKDYPTHLAIYMGNNMILHQLFNCQSRIENLSENWVKRILFGLRHKNNLKTIP